MTVLYNNISALVTNDPSVGDGTALGILRGAALLVGPGVTAPAADHRVDSQNRTVITGFVDSTHLLGALVVAAEDARRRDSYVGLVATETLAACALDRCFLRSRSV